MLENKNKQVDELHFAGGRYCNVYKVLKINLESICRKNAKAKNVKTSFVSCNGIKKEKRNATEKTERRG